MIIYEDSIIVQRDGGCEYAVKHIDRMMNKIVLKSAGATHTVTKYLSELEALLDIPGSAWSIKQ